MRSKALTHFLNRTSETNNYLSHILFVTEQFYIDNYSLLEKKGDLLTADQFGNNKFSGQHNVKMRLLSDQKIDSIVFLMNTVFISINTQFEVFLKGLYLFVKKNFDDDLKELNKFKVYDTFLENLNIKNSISSLLLSTYDYFVLRRNALVHRDKSKILQGDLREIIKNDGKKLNVDWKKHAKELMERKSKEHTILYFDFCTKEIETFKSEEIIDTINFYRLLAKKIDKLVINDLDNDKVTQYLKSNFEKIYKHSKNCNDYNSFKKKFSHFARGELNKEFNESELKNIFSGV